MQTGILAIPLGWGRTGIRLLWASFLPPVCVACRGLLSPQSPGLGFCPACYNALPRLDTALHPAIARLVETSAFDSLLAPCLYARPVDGLIHRFKYAGQAAYGAPLARLVAGVMPPADETSLIVPVPLHRLRLLKRTYNQAAILAKHLSQQLNIPWQWDGLRRTRHTRHQAKSTATVRKRALHRAFVADPRVAGKHVILVDDVVTTGSTAQACAVALKAAGAARVDVVAVAYVAKG